MGDVVRVRRRARGPGAVVSVRLDSDEFRDVAAAAERTGTYVSDYIRRVVVTAARRRLKSGGRTAGRTGAGVSGPAPVS